ncbi:glycoside hydrolase family 89 protein [Coleophoma crateriformis]|uniref:Glycoside hydrolase family 89 protein n=1 Tax=Coleophoma crateriformis TaxID=565419 RepID=A0A3D8T0R3_9HELO|nr:glycoside hydrolase family 89 protein [Coleophoma crateriformis]
MRLLGFGFLCFSALVGCGSAQSIDGVIGLLQRRLPDHVDSFTFRLSNLTSGVIANSSLQNDVYTVSSTTTSKILIVGNTPIALASGLHRYLTDVLQVDLFWGIGSRLDATSIDYLPTLDIPLSGTSIVPWRYHFNTVTFSYTSAFWSWEDWELQLDWMALRGINLPLAWVGQEKILVDTFREINMTDAEITSFLSGPAFQAWNRFGNIQGSWGSELPMEWIDSQFELQKKIVARMVQLGMTPVLPAFTGFVPRAITRVKPTAQVVNGSQWSGFPTDYTNVTFLEPLDSLFTELQTSFIQKQTAAYGNVTNIYTLDQYNENDPYSGELEYLSNVTYNTWKSLKAADPEAIWLMQGWLFYSNSVFWTDARVEAYLGGVTTNDDMLILDLFSESQPQWQRTNSYFGKPWIWCQLHDYGGNMGLYGQVLNVTINPIEALSNSSSLVGFGSTMEGQEGNEIMYDLLLDQAWSASPIDTAAYFANFVTRRYAGNNTIPADLYTAWDILRTSVYNNTNLTASTAVTKSIFELAPNITGMLGRTGHHATTVTYDPTLLVEAWTLIYNASKTDTQLWNNPSYQYDVTDITRQVMSNNFNDLYTSLIDTYTSTNASTAAISAAGKKMIDLLTLLDSILSTNTNFALSTWLSAAKSWTNSTNTTSFYEYNARNQITLWGPTGQIDDYASKSWGGLVKDYYVPRWNIFISYLETVAVGAYNTTVLDEALLVFGEAWCVNTTQRIQSNALAQSNSTVLQGLVEDLAAVWV